MATLTLMTDPSLLGGVDTKKLGRQLPLSLGEGVIENAQAQGQFDC